jgi:hypothetical protein
VSTLADLFPAGPYRFHLSLRRDQPEAFFRPQDPTGQVLAERARWLADDSERYAALRPEGVALAEEFHALSAGWAPAGQGRDLIRQLGCQFEPDLLLLSADDAGRFRLRGGALCFPTGWALEEKIGHPLEFIHGVVPGLNSAIGNSIHQFLARLKPGAAFCRDNWGLAASAELNLHPVRRVALPSPPVSLDRLWLRVEHQILFSLPGTKGIVFGIRIALHRLDQVALDPVAEMLREALLTMPADVAAYKRVDTVREEVARQLAPARGTGVT